MTVVTTRADLVVSVTEVAVIVNKGYAGTVAGAVYVTGAPLTVLAGEMLPHPGEQAIPFCFKVQVTPPPAPPFDPSLVTVAVNDCVALAATLAEVGETDTEMGRIVMLAVALARVLVREVAIAATVPKGGFTGAV
ncbi:MAG TPA: hypothetical protein VNY09_04780 [Candidatus Sulfotelmatobacter sp.]|nr:hypothetical protein [Candidatus Sulfotelmatobacter sp.]